MNRFHTVGGAIDQTAVIGHPPEHRDWHPTDDAHQPDIHPTARIEALCTIDAGMRIPTRIGAHTWLMKRVHIGHDTWIGDYCELAPGTVIGGHVTIGHRARIGINACVRPGITIGEGARIGAGAVVIRDVPPGEVWAGNPARRLNLGATTGKDAITDEAATGLTAT